MDGTVLERNVAPGQSVLEHLTAFRIANLDHLWVELRVFERSVRRIRQGDAVELQPFGNTADIISGRVAHVGALIDPATRSADVRVEVENRDRKLRAGEAVKAIIRASGEAIEGATLVPSKAITFIDGKPAVFVVDSPVSVRRVSVELGDADGTQQQVLAGLSPGQEVITTGVFDLKSELFR
jgi:cobalt-zinc-cadmium efflux system membrane fusion protein